MTDPFSPDMVANEETETGTCVPPLASMERRENTFTGPDGRIGDGNPERLVAARAVSALAVPVSKPGNLATGGATVNIDPDSPTKPG
jgi:hypothetical protein